MDKITWATLLEDHPMREDDLESFDGDWDDTSPGHIDDSSSTSTEVDDTPSNEWSAIINATDHAFTVVNIRYLNTSIEWECFVGTGDTIRFERFTISGTLPLPIVRCFSTEGTCPIVELGSKGYGRDVGALVDCLDWTSLIGLIESLTIQILEGTYEGPHRSDIIWASKGWSKATATEQKG